MNRDEFEGNWHELKGKIREKWGKFTHDDVAKFNGKYEQFLGQLQKKYGYTKELAEREIKNWHEGLGKRGHMNREESSSWSERKTHEASADEDVDSSGSTLIGRSFEEEDTWKSDEMNKHKKKDEEDQRKDKKRKAS